MIHWRKILRITGGNLELSKTVVYLIDFVFHEGGRFVRHKSIDECPGDIIMPAELPTEKDIKIRRYEPGQAERYLGVRVAHNGQMNTEF